MNVVSTLTITAPPALQSCLRCRRVVTKREQHDAVEERVLETIRAEHPEWASITGASDPYLNQYRKVLQMRKSRSARARAERLHARVRRSRQLTRLSELVRRCWRGRQSLEQ
jgi:hypothetical protein